jgi:gamma-butyrobetaine dioxygenase/trimethyllysine dioxygenase
MPQATAELHDDWLRLRLADPAGPSHVDVHYRWLRHNANEDRHPRTGERTLCSSELPDDLKATDVQIDGDTVSVRWSDGSGPSRYQLAWLVEHAYAAARPAVPRPPSDLTRLIVSEGKNLDELIANVLATAQQRGAAVVRANTLAGLGLGTDPETQTEPIVAAFAHNQHRVIETHFGRIEDLRPDNTTNKNTDQLGYTNAAVELHTDQPFIDNPPRYQMLQAIRPADQGGDNTLVDALAVARYLADNAADELELLTTVPVHFHRKQKAFTSLVVKPILEVVGPLDAPSHFQVRYSYFTMAPFKLPFARMAAWYRAYDHFARLVRDPRNHYSAPLAKGDFVLYDNHKMMHARTSFAGPRWMRGVYFEPI